MAYLLTVPPPKLGQVWLNVLKELPERSTTSIQMHFQSKILPVLSAKKKGVDAEDMERWKTQVLEIVKDEFQRNVLKFYEDINPGNLAKRVGKGCNRKQISEFFSRIRNTGVKSGRQSIQEAISFELDSMRSGSEEANNEGSLHVSSHQSRKTLKGAKKRDENDQMWKESVIEHWDMLNSSKILPHKKKETRKRRKSVSRIVKSVRTPKTAA